MSLIGFHQAGYRPQQHPGNGIGENRTDANPLEQPLQELGHHQEQAYGKQGVKNFHAANPFGQLPCNEVI